MDVILYSLLVDRDRFIETFLKAYCEFGSKGSWGRYEDGKDFGPCVTRPFEVVST